MKKIFYTGFFLPIVSTLFAQPTLTYSSEGPQIGQVFTIYQATIPPASPGNSGANQTWDFSSVPVNGALGPASWVDPTKTLWASDFPSANLALDYDGAYYYFDSDSLGLWQIGWEVPEFKNVFTIPQQQRTFPFTYQNSYNGKYFVNETLPGAYEYDSCKQTVTADAYGTLKIPEGDYFNVLREKVRDTEIDTLIRFVGGTEGSKHNQTSYLYFEPGDSYPLMTLTLDTFNDTESFSSCYFVVPGITGLHPVSVFGSKLQLFPNPADKRTTLLFSLQQGDQVSLSIYNTFGEMVKSIRTKRLPIGTNEIQIDLSGLASGEYILVVRGDKKSEGELRFAVY